MVSVLFSGLLALLVCGADLAHEDDYSVDAGDAVKGVDPAMLDAAVQWLWSGIGAGLSAISAHQLYQTDFGGPDGSAPPGWAVAQGVWSIQSNGYRQNQATGVTRSWYGVGPQAALSVQVSARLESGSALRIYWTAADMGAHYVEWDRAGQRIRVIENAIERRNVAFFTVLNEPYECRVEVKSGRLYVYVNHNHWLDVAASAPLDGKVGLGTRDAVATFDDVLVLDALFFDEQPIIRLPYPNGDSLVGSLAPRMYSWTTPGISAHFALDFGGPELWWAAGQPVVPIAPGIVTRAEYAEIGNTVTVLHANGYESHYGHFDRMLVQPGEEVDRNTIIGLMGHTGAASFDHVHIQLHRRGGVIRPEPMSGYRTFCHYEVDDTPSGCGEWYTSDNSAAVPERVGVVQMPDAIGNDTPVCWRDDFADWVVDQKRPAPVWTLLDTRQRPEVGDNALRGHPWGRGDLFEQDGWLNMTARGDWSQSSIAWLRTMEQYQDFSLELKLRFADAAPYGNCPYALAEVRFREADDGGPEPGPGLPVSATGGMGYSLVFDAVADQISLRRINIGTLVDSRQTTCPISTGTTFYVRVTCDDTQTDNIHVRVGTNPGTADVLDWRVSNREYALGSIRLVNHCATRTAWDWIEVCGVAYYDELPPPTVPADFDRDGDVDQEDFGRLQACLSGAGVPQNVPACVNARLDSDEDVDAGDVAIFQRCLSGPDVPANPNCAQ
jgi:murein DD-endopeptidase MepM/ murein hydrolase activator NlpD